MGKKLVSVNVEKPRSSIYPKVREWQLKNWEEFEKWIKESGGSIREETDHVAYPKGTYVITFTPVE